MLIYVTNHNLCQEPLLERVDRLLRGHPSALLLREKTMSLTDYKSLALQVKALCTHYQVPLLIHQHISVASDLHLPYIHLPLPELRRHHKDLSSFMVGASVHSTEEAFEAERLGAAYVIAGHVYPTQCKQGLPSRGLSFLRNLCQAVSIPVFGIGGITRQTGKDVLDMGAKGVCLMSEAMTCNHPTDLSSHFLQKENIFTL